MNEFIKKKVKIREGIRGLIHKAGSKEKKGKKKKEAAACLMLRLINSSKGTLTDF